MAEQNPRLSVDTEATHTHVVLLDEEILHELQIRQIQDELNALLASGGAVRLVLDFSRVVRLSSMALGMLTVAHKHVLERGGRLTLCCIDPKIYRIFELSKLNRILQIHDTVAEAVAALA